MRVFVCLCLCTLWCNKEQFFWWGVQQIARRGLCVSFSSLLCVSVSLCLSAFFVSCLCVSVCVCARCAWDCHRLFLMTCTEQYGDNGNMKRVLRHESFAQCACALCHSSDAMGKCALRMCIVSFFGCTVHRALRCALCHSLDDCNINLQRVHLLTQMLLQCTMGLCI